jgi:hypothetical protein
MEWRYWRPRRICLALREKGHDQRLMRLTAAANRSHSLDCLSVEVLVEVPILPQVARCE